MSEIGVKFKGKTTAAGNIVIAEIVSFFGRDNAVWIDINLGEDPPTVDLHGQEPNEAAKVFWNAVLTVVGRPPLFEDVLDPLDAIRALHGGS